MDIHEQLRQTLAGLQAASAARSTPAAGRHKRVLSRLPEQPVTPSDAAEAFASAMAEATDELTFPASAPSPDAATSDDTPAVSSDGDTPPLPAAPRRIPVAHWEALATDMALDRYPLQSIAEAYGTTVEDIRRLARENGHFARLLSGKQEEVASLDNSPSRAAFATEMRAVVNRSTRFFAMRLSDPSTSTKDFAALFALGARLARFDAPSTDIQAGGTSVVFNIQGVPGLEHTSRGSPSSIIDVQVSPPTAAAPTMSNGDDA